MANTYFNFKQFTVNQANTAMKVGTDGVLLGAWCDCTDAKSILDIGTGTGLLALMCAQRNSLAKITAIDIEPVTDASENFKASVWSDRLHPKQIALQEFDSQVFDHIITNPPYFNNSLKNPNEKRSTARHTDSLSYQDLAKSCKRLLAPEGKISLVIPTLSEDELINIFAEQGLYPNKICKVIPKIGAEPKRSLIELSLNKQEIEMQDLTIELDERHKYSKEYRKLTKNYYLDKI